MKTISRWDPLRDMITMRHALDRALDDTFTRGAESRGTGAWLLPMDAYITDDAIVIRADIPGITSDELDITLEGDTLTIRGEIKREEAADRRYVLLERPTGRFERTLNVNTPINHDADPAQSRSG